MHTQLTNKSAVFSTLLAVNGKPQKLEQHIARLRNWGDSQWQPIRFESLFTAIFTILYHQDLLSSTSRIRIIYSADGIELDAQPYTLPTEPFVLIPHEIDSPLGSVKKWPFVNLGIPEKGDLLLIERETGRILEGNRTTLFFRTKKGVVTPSLDGSILPGIARDNIIRICRVLHIPLEERPLYFNEIGSWEIYVSNALIGLRCATLSIR